MFYSPLRYPGGKNRLAKFIAQICVDNDINGHYVEPYAGGASVALYLLIENKLKKITINDKDKSIYAFWYSVLNYTYELCSLVEKTKINIENWRRQKEIQKNKNTEKNLLKLGFSTFFLNRTNWSGIINAGVIGGLEQKGKYKIDCRFNKQNLINRIKKIAKYKDRIELKNLDALELIKQVRKTKNTLFYFDPPYFIKGPGLYMNSYKLDDHKKVANEIKKIKNAKWIVSYDNVSEIKEIYKGISKKIEFNLTYTAFSLKKGKEILFFNDGLNVNFQELMKLNVKINP